MKRFIMPLFYLGSTPLLFAAPVKAVSPSFDCQAAKSKVEKAICNDENFSSYDILLSKTYSQKKSDPNFSKDYQSWIKDRNSCNSKDEHDLTICLRNQYAVVFGLLYEKYDGPTEPLIPSKECIFPLIGHMNGDQGFYAMRLISSIRGCDNLNLTVNQSEKPATVTFLSKEGKVYYYQYTNSDSNNEVIGVSFSLRYITRSYNKKTVKDPTLVMTVESN
ncbi:MAG: hypothetical protein EOP04_06160 [Proteobacteria bacterium]|nr:MAG: hypothetical protein EOP04_06160 [Pseudomonadota bacterium]